MKDSVSTEEAVLKAERRARRKRRKTAAEASHGSQQGASRDESMTPPRSKPKYMQEEDAAFDESSLPPESARKRDEELFYESMADAAEQDAGVGYYENLLFEREAQKRAAAFSHGGAAGVAMGFGSAASNGMDEEEYAEYIRAGMWRRKNKEEVERMERLEKQRKEKAAKESAENEKRQRVERERIKKLEEKKRKNSEKEERDARERYESLWKKLAAAPAPVAPKDDENDAPASGPCPLRFTDFPWPLYPPMPLPPLSWPAPKDVTATAMSTFLLSHLPADKRKVTLRQAVLAYHPDRFQRLVLRIPEDKQELRERVRELGLRVSQTLNELMKAGGEA